MRGEPPDIDQQTLEQQRQELRRKKRAMPLRVAFRSDTRSREEITLKLSSDIRYNLMNNNLIFRRVIELGALFLIGDGVMGLLKPRWHSLLWHFGPQLARAATEELAEHPKTARAVYLAEAAIGVALASCQTPEVE